MPQAETGNKIKYAGIAIGMPVALALAACEAITKDDLPAAPKRIAVETAPADKTESAAAEGDEIPEAPPVKTYVYETGYSNVWQETQNAGQTATAPTQAGYTSGDANSGFDGDTFSVIDPTATAPQNPTEPDQSDTQLASTVKPVNPGASERLPVTGNAVVPAAGQYGLHLASYRVEQNAPKGWAVLKDQYTNVLMDREPRLQLVDIPGKGSFFRLVIGPFTSRGSAASACEKIKEAGDYCVVTEYGGDSLAG